MRNNLCVQFYSWTENKTEIKYMKSKNNLSKTYKISRSMNVQFIYEQEKVSSSWTREKAPGGAEWQPAEPVITALRAPPHDPPPVGHFFPFGGKSRLTEGHLRLEDSQYRENIFETINICIMSLQCHQIEWHQRHSDVPPQNLKNRTEAINIRFLE